MKEYNPGYAAKVLFEQRSGYAIVVMGETGDKRGFRVPFLISDHCKSPSDLAEWVTEHYYDISNTTGCAAIGTHLPDEFPDSMFYPPARIKRLSDAERDHYFSRLNPELSDF